MIRAFFRSSQRQFRIGLALFVFFSVVMGMPRSAQAGNVTLIRAPNGGIQPQAVMDAQGGLHLIYFRGDPAHGDIFYVHKILGRDAPFSVPIRVNSQPGTAIAVGTIRGAQIAVGKLGSVYVTWNSIGSKGENGYPVMSLAFTRLNVSGEAFEPQRSLSAGSAPLDGGGSVAADQAGNVYVLWHNSPVGRDEASGGVTLTRSHDRGASFDAPRKVNPAPTGQCGCCAMRASTDAAGAVYVLYRSAQANVSRDATLLVSQDKGQTFTAQILQAWPINACPMSSFSLAAETGGIVGAWETLGQVYFGAFGDQRKPTIWAAATGSGRRKYPAVAANTAGEILLAWVEGAGWERGGTLVWQVFGSDGHPTTEKGTADGIPPWSLITAITRPNGTFVIFF